MARYEPKEVNSQSTSDTVTVTFTAPFPFSSLAAVAIDSNGDPVPLADVTGGTATVEILTSVNPFWEQLKDDTGSQVSLDFTAPETSIASEAPVLGVRITPSSLTGTGVTGIRLTVDQYR